MAHCPQENHLVLMSCGADANVVRFMPPLVVSEAEIEQAIAAFDGGTLRYDSCPRRLRFENDCDPRAGCASPRDADRTHD